jgi:hypothetical protein
MAWKEAGLLAISCRRSADFPNDHEMLKHSLVTCNILFVSPAGQRRSSIPLTDAAA